MVKFPAVNDYSAQRLAGDQHHLAPKLARQSRVRSIEPSAAGVALSAVADSPSKFGLSCVKTRSFLHEFVQKSVFPVLLFHMHSSRIDEIAHEHVNFPG